MKTLDILDRLDAINDLLSLESTPKHPHIDSAIGMIALLEDEIKRNEQS